MAHPLALLVYAMDGFFLCNSQRRATHLLTAGAYEAQLVSKASPNARRRESCRAVGTQAGAPASRSAPDGGPRARTCTQTWFLRRARSASNSHERTWRRGDPERPKVHL